jgi:hypothetical protein
VTAWALAAGCGGVPAETPAPAPPSAPRWIVDPREAGPSLPPAGRSVFDHLLADAAPGGQVPFPFEALAAAIERRTGAGGTASVLVPRGRSLQRDAGAPHFFALPRAVLAATGDGADLKLADRLFVAYHERAAVLEVVSYNEAAGRFEFQVVRDYRAGGRPRVAYANRELCTACHQNGGPIFARPLWDETNASPEVALLLRKERAAFYGVPSRADVDAAYAVDNATDRGNLLAAYQLLWSEGCGEGAAGRGCRAALLARVLARRLGDATHAEAAPAEAVGRAWAERFPRGLLLPTADIPNRLPLRADEPRRGTALAVPLTRSPEARDRLAALVRASDVPSSLEPLQPRPPAESWTARGLAHGLDGRVTAGLGTFLTDDDAQRLDERLASLHGPPDVLRGTCTVAAPAGGAEPRVSFVCAAGGGVGFALTGRVRSRGARGLTGSIDSVSFAGVQETGALDVRGDAADTANGRRLTLALRSALTGRRARRADGRRLERLVLRWRDTAAEAELTLVDDVDALSRAVAALAEHGAGDPRDALGQGPFRRARVMGALERALGLPHRERCCEDAAALPPPDVDGAAPARVDAADPLAALRRYCGRCHDTPDRFPPNFLHGSDAPARVARCAERIAFRLGMWTLPAAQRPKTPMPPPAALQALHLSSESWPTHPDLLELRRLADAAGAGRAGGRSPLADISGREYASLPPCLAEATP